jgi:hypothetical protein
VRRSTVVRQEVAVGAFLVAAVGLVAVGAVLKTRERGFIGATTFRFSAAHGSGLQPGAPVLVQGVQVGEVSDIRLTPDNRVAVTVPGVTSTFVDPSRRSRAGGRGASRTSSRRCRARSTKSWPRSTAS